jgi:hypothetical protein
MASAFRARMKAATWLICSALRMGPQAAIPFSGTP